eukprot:1173463-Lingulodinium_polyedra.AAC.1
MESSSKRPATSAFVSSFTRPSTQPSSSSCSTSTAATCAGCDAGPPEPSTAFTDELFAAAFFRQSASRCPWIPQ